MVAVDWGAGGVSDQELFDFEEGRRRKEMGMCAGALARPYLLRVARRQAVKLAKARESRTVTADDVQMCLSLLYDDYDPGMLGPASGSIFSGPEWRFTGQRIRSGQVRNHARELKVWEYVGDTMDGGGA